MSKYMEDIQGRIVSNPINETNTKYPFNEQSEDNRFHNDNYPIDTQYMYNGEPVSDFDTAYYDDYRNKVEELRKRTESTYEALESCLVPVEIPGMSFQPYEFNITENEDGEEVIEKSKAFTYFFQDHLSPIGFDSKEFVFRTNKVKFIDDRHRRLIYDRMVHLMTLKEDEDNKVSFKEVIYRTFFEHCDWYDKDENHYPLTKTRDAIDIVYDDIVNCILNNNDKIIAYGIDGKDKPVEKDTDFELVFKSGQDINTGVPSTVYNLYNIGWVEASAIFLNGIMMPWTKIVLSVDNIDTFIIVSKVNENVSELIDDDEEIFLDYIHIPFKVEYISGNSLDTNSPIYKKYFPQGASTKDIIFVIDKSGGGIRFNTLTTDIDFTGAKIESNTNEFDRIICVDPNIKYAEFTLGDDNELLKDIGIEYTKSFKAFCDNDYRCKLKQFNFLGFELNRYFDDDPNKRGTFKNDDFTVTWHPFNIMDIRFDHLFNRKRVFKVFYNTKVLYDQDNILRIKNHDYLSEEYERYIKDVTANIETYINEIYILAKKDIGTYIATEGKMVGYKYHYVTPYECFMLYNIIGPLLGISYTTFDDFKNINISPNSTDTLNYLDGAFIAIPKDEESMFLKEVKESDLYENGRSIKSEVMTYFENIIAAVNGITMFDILFPIDPEAFYNFENDSRGKITPYRTDGYIFEQDYDTIYDVFKLRFEMTYLNNMEEGATPVDEFIYYFDNVGMMESRRNYPIVLPENIEKRKTAINLDALADNVFKNDPYNVLNTIKKLNWSADFIIYETIPDKNLNRKDIIVTLDDESNIPPSSDYDYRYDPRHFYNFGYYDSNNKGKPKILSSEWGLRRNLPEMFYWSINKNDYTIDSMHLLDEVFDFTYDFNKSYEENLRHGTNYIIGYDADKLEQSIKRSVVSFSKTARELKDHMFSHPCIKECSLADYKLITFVKNKNQKIAFDNIEIRVSIPVHVENSIPSSITYREKGESRYEDFTDAQMKHTSQENYTVIKTANSFKDVDKGFVQQFTSVVYNREKEVLEYYNDNELVIILQVDKVQDNSRLQMSRWSIGQQDNYVMIFKNRELYKYYNTIEYTDLYFSVVFDTESANDDVFEFVFFLNANNTIMKKKCETNDDIKLTVPSGYYSLSSENIRVDRYTNPMDKGLYENVTSDYYPPFNSAIPCNTSILDAENVQLLVNTMPAKDDDKWTVSDNSNTTYELEYKMYSYKASTNINVQSERDDRYFTHVLEEDKKINGLHRVTKQGGGEYILEFDGTVPDKSSSSSDGGSGVIINPGQSSSNLGLGAYSLATKNVNTIKFNGTPNQWNAISKALPWISSVQNLHGITCNNDERAEVSAEETADGKGTTTVDKSLLSNIEEET